ncbi:SRPBCC family protein [Streptacidiphilus rugosus]|uniref:SRPBCC family protein n=1 Tax=Streptacidiphilus rugosus TaxID=405783 RepID=UPI00068DAF80|nr:SRPBCC family protein [Streptacidiphilus rugosus]
MTHRLRPVGLPFLSDAPHRYTFTEPVAAPRAVVFASISADPSTWTVWFPRLRGGAYLSAPPHGVGTVRQADTDGIVYRETMLAWQTPSRWAYRLDSCSQPLAEALAEDWVLHDAGGGTLVEWTFAIDPGPLVAPHMDQLPARLRTTFRTAMNALSLTLGG